jgi:hypothetical protein
MSRFVICVKNLRVISFLMEDQTVFQARPWSLFSHMFGVLRLFLLAGINTM